MVARTLANSAAAWAVAFLTSLLAYSRNFLSCWAAAIASLERPFLASSITLAILLSKAFIALARSAAAFLALDLMLAAFWAMWALVFLILALVASSRAERARCWFLVAAARLARASALFLRMSLRVARKRLISWR